MKFDMFDDFVNTASSPIDKVINIYNGLLMVLESVSHLCEMSSFNKYAEHHGWGTVYESIAESDDKIQIIRLYYKKLKNIRDEITSTGCIDNREYAEIDDNRDRAIKSFSIIENYKAITQNGEEIAKLETFINDEIIAINMALSILRTAGVLKGGSTLKEISLDDIKFHNREVKDEV
jgi:hypothetical protein